MIGIIACGREVEGEPAQAVKHRYLEAVVRYAGAIALIVPTNQPTAHAAAIMARLDAVLLTGSNSNIAPDRYGSDAAARLPQDPDRDGLAAALIHAAIAAGKPLFGICRGLQEINVALGGSLADTRDGAGAMPAHHAPQEASLAETFAFSHPIDVLAGTPLSRITGSRTLVVNSVHYQTIGRLAEGLAVNATSPDGVIEAVSSTDTAAPVFAVQWHPEWRPENRPHDLAFLRYLGEAARMSQLETTQ